MILCHSRSSVELRLEEHQCQKDPKKIPRWEVRHDTEQQPRCPLQREAFSEGGRVEPPFTDNPPQKDALVHCENTPGHHCHLQPCPPMELCIQTGPSLPSEPLLELRKTKEAKRGSEVPRSISPPFQWDPIPNQSKFNTNKGRTNKFWHQTHPTSNTITIKREVLWNAENCSNSEFWW